MINEATFKISVGESLQLLKEINILKGKGNKNLGDHSTEFKKISRSNRHTDIYKTAILNSDYEILIFDDSIFQFGLNDGVLRYAFIQNPQVFLKKEDFISSIYGPDELLELSEEELVDLVNSVKEGEYEQFLDEQDINLESHILRYDLDLKGYRPLVHAYSHIHIGLNSNLRLPCSKILTPLQFVIFSIKHTYYSEWKNAIFENETMESFLHNSKRKCIDVPNSHWIDKEKFELYLT